jgi:hypothetical protein
MSPSRRTGRRTAAQAANSKISETYGRDARAASNGRKTPKKTATTKSKISAPQKPAAKRPAKPNPEKHSQQENSIDRTSSHAPYVPSSFGKEFTKVMRLGMWLFENSDFDTALFEKPRYYPQTNPTGPEYTLYCMLYRHLGGSGLMGCSFSVQEPRTETWRCFNAEKEMPPLHMNFGSPEGFSRDHETFNVISVWRYGKGIDGRGEVMLRVEQKTEKKCRLIQVKGFEQALADHFQYQKGFVNAGDEGDYTTNGQR